MIIMSNNNSSTCQAFESLRIASIIETASSSSTSTSLPLTASLLQRTQCCLIKQTPPCLCQHLPYVLWSLLILSTQDGILLSLRPGVDSRRFRSMLNASQALSSSVSPCSATFIVHSLSKPLLTPLQMMIKTNPIKVYLCSALQCGSLAGM